MDDDEITVELGAMFGAVIYTPTRAVIQREWVTPRVGPRRREVGPVPADLHAAVYQSIVDMHGALEAEDYLANGRRASLVVHAVRMQAELLDKVSALIERHESGARLH